MTEEQYNERVKALTGIAREVYDALEFHNDKPKVLDWSTANLKLAEKVAQLEISANEHKEYLLTMPTK